MSWKSYPTTLILAHWWNYNINTGARLRWKMCSDCVVCTDCTLLWQTTQTMCSETFTGKLVLWRITRTIWLNRDRSSMRQNVKPICSFSFFLQLVSRVCVGAAIVVTFIPETLQTSLSLWWHSSKRSPLPLQAHAIANTSSEMVEGKDEVSRANKNFIRYALKTNSTDSSVRVVMALPRSGTTTKIE